MEKFSNLSRLYLIFVFIFYFLYLFFLIILKLIYFIKNKNIMIFYKLFIQKHYNYFFEEILIIIIIIIIIKVIKYIFKI